jgi:hypothetical protein
MPNSVATLLHERAEPADAMDSRTASTVMDCPKAASH